MSRPDESPAAIFRAATQAVALREATTLRPEKADAAAAMGRDRFWDVFAGRFGLPGAAFTEPRDLAAQAAQRDGASAGSRYDLTAMSARQVIELADRLRADGALEAEPADLLGLRPQALPYAGDPVFSASPVSRLAAELSGGFGPRFDGTWNWIAEHTAQHRYLVEEGGDARAVRGSERLLQQLYQLQAEQALYAVQDQARDRREEGRAGAGAAVDPFAGRFVGPSSGAGFGGDARGAGLERALSDGFMARGPHAAAALRTLTLSGDAFALLGQA
ncbi:MAG: hypothetical protein RIB45_05020 [Marivibrio sp.]|uniref:hypothetical protein n=1 Tax=Marivibrio sp. TaxID=2039719 RepID=UPI0032EC5779